MSRTIQTSTISTVVLFVLVFVAGVAGAQPEVSARVDKTEAVIGDRIRLTVSAADTKGYEVRFPEGPPKLEDFSLIGAEGPMKGTKGALEKVYILGIYSTGTHVIPPVSVAYKKAGDSEWSEAATPQVPIEVKSLLTGDDKDIRDIKGLVILRSVPLMLLPWLALLAAAAAGVYYLVRRRKEALLAEAMRKKSAHEVAYSELAELKAEDLPGKGMVKEYYVRLSDIVRHYIENRFAYRAPEMTTEEFLNYIKLASEMGDDHRTLLRKFLTHCDMVKFAKYGPTPLEVIDSFKLAERFVDQTRVYEQEEEKA